jgi:hypothetical protein
MKNRMFLLIVTVLLATTFVEANPKPCGKSGEMVFGLTTEFVNDTNGIIRALETFKDICLPTIRVVFQGDTPPESYREPLRRIHGDETTPRLAYVMGLLVDSEAMHLYRDTNESRPPAKTKIVKRANLFANTLGKYVDIWEIGNELNGTWVGWNQEDKDSNGNEKYKKKSFDDLRKTRAMVGRQIIQVYDALEKNPNVQKPFQTALNLYFYKFKENQQEDCFEALKHCEDDCANDYEMLQWSEKYLKPLMGKRRFDYVYFSYYGDDCDNVSTSTALWAKLFAQLSDAFTIDGQSPKVGFGEVGPQCNKCPKDSNGNINRFTDCCLIQRKPFIDQYYNRLNTEVIEAIGNLKGKKPNYVGGFFYWYFYQDAVQDKNFPDVADAFATAANAWK